MPDEREPWYRTSAAVFAAGGVGLVLVIALVVAVVQMSDRWTVPTPSYTPVTVATTTATSRSELPTTPTTIITTTAYPTASVSTTDINSSLTSPSSSETSGSETTSLSKEPEEDEPVTRTPRRTPRTNITRTLYPRPIN